MSVESVSRIAAILALDGDKLSSYMNEDTRSDLVSSWSSQLDGNTERDLLESADWNRIYAYIGSQGPRPVGGDKRGN
jgi:hypothetical protein